MSAVLEQFDFEGVDLDQLPPQTRLIARAIGLSATVKLLAKRGGAPLKVPVDGTNSQMLCSIIGEEKAVAFCQAFRHRTLSLPKLDKAILQIRNRQIRAEREAGRSLTELAWKYDRTTRQILNICRDVTTENPQEELF